MESSRARDWTRVPCFGRQILIHSSIREVLALCFEDSGLSSDSWNSPVALVFCVTQVLQENRTSRRLSIYLCIYLLSTMRSYMTVEAEKNHMICRLQLEWSQWYSSSSVQFSRSVMSDSLWPHEPQHARPPCPSPTPGVYPNSCPLSRWHHPTILCHPLLLLPSIPPSIRVFSNESALRIRWPKYWSFSFNISPSNEHPGLISSRMDWLDLLAVQGTLKSLLQHHTSKASILRCAAFFSSSLSPKPWEPEEPMVEIPVHNQEKMISWFSQWAREPSVDWQMPTHMGRATCFTESTSASANLTQKHPHTMIPHLGVQWPSQGDA